MKIRCDDCGNIFDFSDNELQFYKAKGLQLPKRCKNCREKRKTQGNDYKPNIGYKTSSFCENAQIYGMPIEASLRPSVEYDYIICADTRNKHRFVFLDLAKREYYFVDTEAEASSHQISNELRGILTQLQKSHSDYKFTLNPHSKIVFNVVGYGSDE